MSKTNVKYTGSAQRKVFREVFDVSESEAKLGIYVKSNLKVYDVVAVGEARLEREEFCAARFKFTVLKDGVVSFNQGDSVCVKYDGETIFSGFVFTKSRDKEGLIDVVCYDLLRYLKNRRTYTRGKMTLGEMIRQIAEANALAQGVIADAGEMLSPMAADNISLLDVIVKGCKEARKISGKRYIVYDDKGFLTMRDEEDLVTDILIDSTQAENFVYKDTIDEGVYNVISLYNDTKKLNLRRVTEVWDESTVEKWGKLILSKKATDAENSTEEAKRLLEEYNRINREIVIKTLCGDVRFLPGAWVYLRMSMGDLYFDGYVRCKKAVHIFGNNMYTVDLYIDGSEVG